jgi:ABC-type branched-subunit amino acid transport system substrate-binding protein
LLTAACGARLTDEQKVAAQGSGAAGAGVAGADAAGGTAADAGTGTAAAGPGTPTAAGPGGSTAAASGGAGGSTGGSTGGAAAGGAGGAAACAPDPAAKEVGVSATEIKLGNVSTITGAVPGFGRTGVNGAKAYLNYVNATQGGVCGRKLTLVPADDRLDEGANRSETERLAGQVFGFVGGTTVSDDGGATVLAGTNIADTSLAIGEGRIALPNSFSPNPIDLACNCNGTVGIFKWMKANLGVSKGAVVWPNQPTARNRGRAYISDMAAAGIDVVVEKEVALAETNYNATASLIKDNGADVVITVLEVNGMAKLAQALQQIGYKPKAPFYGAQAYGPQFAKQAGAAAEGTVLGLTYSIFEDKASNPGIAAFLEWYSRTNPGSEPDFFAVMGWSSAAMMVDALKQAGPAPTRDKVLAALKSFTEFTAGGILAPRNPAAKRMGPGFLVVKYEGGTWKRLYPAQGFGT